MRVLYLLFTARHAARLSLFVQTLEELKLAVGVRLLVRARIDDEELVVNARVPGAYARRARQHGEGFVVAATAHEQSAEVVVRVEVSRVERDGATQYAFGLGVAPALAHDEAQLRERVNVVRLQT
jgi:alkanesulfonate monooxygenase SsuD/methylene tetrahydromethanopterin reductase-like flavin-dependent oxidoreductase (luciferase family)